MWDGRSPDRLGRVCQSSAIRASCGNTLEAMTCVISFLWMLSVAPAQTQSSAAPTLETLLAEVHPLRLTLEQSAQIAPRMHIAVERLKLQQEQVARTGPAGGGICGANWTESGWISLSSSSAHRPPRVRPAKQRIPGKGGISRRACKQAGG